MKEITGTIDHRILLNYKIDPGVMQKHLPEEFKPKLINGYSIGGICQVSLSGMRPKGLPNIFRTQSHNAAHRVAVTTSNGEGVYIFRRDTGSWLNALSGGRIFPGVYKKVSFSVDSTNEHYRVVINEDKDLLMKIDGTVTNQIPEHSLFNSVDEISSFFEKGNVGWSPTKEKGKFDAIELTTVEWRMKPLTVSEEYSGFFSDENKFPKGSVEFDSAMIMRNLEHSWVSRSNLCELCA